MLYVCVVCVCGWVGGQSLGVLHPARRVGACVRNIHTLIPTYIQLDNFITETARVRHEQNLLDIEVIRAKDNMGNVLDPLLRMIAEEYIDEQDLADILRRLFITLVRLSSAALPHQPPEAAQMSKRQVCAAFRLLCVSPPIHFSSSDFDSFTSLARGPGGGWGGREVSTPGVQSVRGGWGETVADWVGFRAAQENVAGRVSLVKANGCLGIKEFEILMRVEVELYLSLAHTHTHTHTHTRTDAHTL